jgi:hypothetical protein
MGCEKSRCRSEAPKRLDRSRLYTPRSSSVAVEQTQRHDEAAAQIWQRDLYSGAAYSDVRVALALDWQTEINPHLLMYHKRLTMHEISLLKFDLQFLLHHKRLMMHRWLSILRHVCAGLDAHLSGSLRSPSEETSKWKLREAVHSVPASSFAAATAGQEGPADYFTGTVRVR